ncbi:Gfo/Idh/MocA family oxidoreductase [Yersinia pseudotuberculosis]|uniref:Gfo/Idh/MocA family oxidoreductase n=1 Tax=Yersinia pseudotuberculosis TaxID=633 RepID=UPI0005EA3812|nr:Gfo/Idh/MocA family oxidoreductase [Yersinia pseudotuberculosis]CFV29762.1 yersiniabactin biosynthetic protein YbtU [Yersinia pseudotuberculosis]
MIQPQKIVVCGTLFGQVYLSAFKTAFEGGELAGILAQGSERSRQLAHAYGVPLYHHVDELPDDINMACVVIRSTIVGGKGSEITKALLKRGISVLQEHPVCLEDVAESLKLARQQGCHYQVNTHYPHVPAVRQFIAYLHEAMQTQKPCFIEATCGVQVICGLLDIIGRVLGGHFSPYGFSVAGGDVLLRSLLENPAPYTQLQGVIAGVPLTLNLQNQLDPAAPDNHFHIMHRLCVGLPSGNLLLVNTHGPVIWSPYFHIPRVRTPFGCREVIDPDDAPHYFLPPLSQLFSQESDNLLSVLHHQWPSAIRHALREFIEQQQHSSPAYAQFLLSLTQVWKTLMEKVGNPESVHFAEPMMASPKVATFLSQWQGERDD